VDVSHEHVLNMAFFRRDEISLTKGCLFEWEKVLILVLDIFYYTLIRHDVAEKQEKKD